MGYYFIDYCPQCGGGYKVCRTSGRYEYDVDKNWHNVDTVNIWSFENYQDAMRFAKSRSDRISYVETSGRATRERDRKQRKYDVMQDVMKFPITERRKPQLSQSEKHQRDLAVARVTSLNDAIYFINSYGRKADAIQAIEGHKKYWQKVIDQYNKQEDGSYVA